jgi:two-component system, OmpR family, heavy metal sensor histidine kinase CusS
VNAPRPETGNGRGRRHRRLSLTARLALLFALVAVVLLLGLGLLLERAVDLHFDEIDAHDLSAKMAVIGHLIERTTDRAALDTLPQRLHDALAGQDHVAVLLRDAEGTVLFGARLDAFERAQLTGSAGAFTGQGWTRDDRHFIAREQTFALPFPRPEPLHALVALDVSHHAHFLGQVRLHLWLGVALAAAFAALLGWLAARQGLAPLNRVVATARHLSAAQLGKRIDARDAPMELRELADAFNGMLDRLETSFQRLSDFSADIAHELRTPVSNLMTETQVALSRSRSADEYREVLHSNLEEFDRLARMIGDMLFLAKADNGLLPQPAEPVHLDAEAEALVEFYEALAEEKGIRLQITGAATVHGDRLMLRRALSNLLSNAIRHTQTGGTVAIRIAALEGEATLAVSNPGPPIPLERLSQLFERFHRIDASRSGHGEGAGLGLAITRSIVEAHGGSIGVESTAELTRFTVRLPSMLQPSPGTGAEAVTAHVDTDHGRPTASLSR